MNHGGIVFGIIILLGCTSVVLFLERLLNLHRARINHTDFLKGVCNVMDKGNEAEALLLCEETPGPVAAVVDAAVSNRDKEPDVLRELVATAGRSQLSRLERRLAFFSVVCEVAPLCGLFGTMLGVYEIINRINASAPMVLTTDFTEALSGILACVSAGLLVAVACHVFYAVLMSRIERITLDIEATSTEIVAYLTRKAK
jgi:biopolymer transport protein ExbB